MSAWYRNFHVTNLHVYSIVRNPNVRVAQGYSTAGAAAVLRVKLKVYIDRIDRNAITTATDGGSRGIIQLYAGARTRAAGTGRKGLRARDRGRRASRDAQPTVRVPRVVGETKGSD